MKSAAHLTDDLRLLVEARSVEEARALCINDHAMIQSNPQPPAEAVTAVLMTALAGELFPGAGFVCLELLGGLVFNDGEYYEERCQEIARQGLWLLYRDLWSGALPGIVAHAFYVLRAIETDESRLRAYRDSGRVELPDYLLD